jgi:hypothetical protein
MGLSHINDYAVGEMPPRLNALKLEGTKAFFHPRRE